MAYLQTGLKNKTFFEKLCQTNLQNSRIFTFTVKKIGKRFYLKKLYSISTESHVIVHSCNVFNSYTYSIECKEIPGMEISRDHVSFRNPKARFREKWGWTKIKGWFFSRASEKPFFNKFVRLIVRPSMSLFVRKYRFVLQIVPDTRRLRPLE